jgi:hypothetical protein
VSSPKLDLTEYQTGYRHHLTVQFSEFDITTFDADFWIADTLQKAQPQESNPGAQPDI